MKKIDCCEYRFVSRLKLSFGILLAVVMALCTSATAETAKWRVACVGDSITYGFGIADREHQSYPAQLGALLGSDWDARNYGVSGATLLKAGGAPYWNQDAY